MKYSFSRHEISCQNFAYINSFTIVDASNFSINKVLKENLINKYLGYLIDKIKMKYQREQS